MSYDETFSNFMHYFVVTLLCVLLVYQWYYVSFAADII